MKTSRNMNVRFARFRCFMIMAAGFLSLMIGKVYPDERLSPLGFPINTIFFLFLLLGLIFIKARRRFYHNLIVLQLPIHCLALTVIWSPDIEYGLYKYINLAVSGNLAVIYVYYSIANFGREMAFKCLLLILLCLLTVTLLYKARFGFFDRNVLFFMNGPIVFARLMGLGAILSLFLHRRLFKFFLYALFAAAVVWTESKGPLLALVLATSLIILFVAQHRARLLSLAVLAIALSSYFFLDFGPAGELGRLFVLAEYLRSGNEVLANSVHEGSIGARLWMYSVSMQMIDDNPLFGVGLGGWNFLAVSKYDFSYPHNLFLELLSEGGFIIGLFASIPFLLFLCPSETTARCIAAYFFFAQQVSGSILDARYLLVFSLLALCLGFERKSEPN